MTREEAKGQRMSELLELAARVEASTADDHECRIREASWLVNVVMPGGGGIAAHTQVNLWLEVGAWLDAARSLVPEGRSYQVNRTDEGGSAYVGTADEWDQHEGKAAAEELALTAAALRARAGGGE